MRTAWLLAWVLGIAGVQQLSALPATAVFVGAGLAALVLAGLALGLGPRRRWVAGLGLAAALAAGFAWAGWRATERLADQLPAADEGRDVRVIGRIDSLPARGERAWRFEFQVEQVLSPGVTVPSGLWLAWYEPAAEPIPGQRWSFTVRLKRPHGTFNPGGFDLEAWMLERDLRATGYVRSAPAPQLLQVFVASPGGLIEFARWRLRAALEQRSEGLRWGGVLLALVLGDQRAIGASDWLVFNRTGISHLVAISGLHITMLASLAAWLVGGLWRRSARLLQRAPAQSAAAVAALLVALAYSLLTGWAVPAQRTFFMLAVLALALMLRARPAAPTALAAAAALVCLLDPWAVMAPGFWLSFGAVAAIFWVVVGRVPAGRAPARSAGLSVLRDMAGTALRVQFAVTLVLVPLLAWLFHQVSLVSPLANLLAIPAVSWVVTPLALLAALALALPGPLDGLCRAFLVAADSVFAALMAWIEWLGGLAWASLPVAAPNPFVLTLALAGAAWLLAPRGWPARWLGGLWMAPLFVWPPERPAADELWVGAIDIGQGAAVLIETRDTTWLYDTGPRHSSESDAGQRLILPYLRARGIHRLDGLVVSHLDSDHSGGAAAILREMPVARVLSSIPPGAAALGGRPAVEACTAGSRWQQGGLAFEVLHPLAADYQRRASSNAMSCVLRIRLAGQSVLLTGDLPATEEARLLDRTDLAARLVMAPHHGSRFSSSSALVAAVSPEWVMVQVGYRNRYGHPAPEVVERWRASGAVMVRSDESGLVQWRLRRDGSALLWRAREAMPRYWHERPPPLAAALVPEPEAETEAETVPAWGDELALPR